MNAYVIKAKQDELKSRLVSNLKNNYANGLWCKIIIYDGRDEGEIVRLMAENNNYFSFTSCGKHYETLLSSVFLVHRDEFVVKWVEVGTNMGNPPATLSHTL